MKNKGVNSENNSIYNGKKEERRKYLGINLIKKVKDLYAGNCKTLLKETGHDTKKWEDILCL